MHSRFLISTLEHFSSVFLILLLCSFLGTLFMHFMPSLLLIILLPRLQLKIKVGEQRMLPLSLDHVLYALCMLFLM